MKAPFLCLLFTLSIYFGCTSHDSMTEAEQSTNGIYFPPLATDVWESKSLYDLGWNANELQPLLGFLEENNTKSFIMLHDGKMVVEAYMNEHDANKPWYWASAGKTLTSAIFGIAQTEGYIDLNTKVSDYIDEGWTSAPLEKENLITCKNLLSMNSGLDDSVSDNISKENLHYKADAGSRWAYHNVYIKIQDAISEATNTSWTIYFNTKLKEKIGMNGAWIKNNDFNVYWSNSRSMARFGLLIYAKGTWNSHQIISDTFLNEATNTSQNINKSYGYLWWLNGKESYHLPGSQVTFSGKLIPQAPDDTVAALGKNDQKIYVVPSKKLVVVRMGDSAGFTNLALTAFDDALWEKINALIN